MPVTLERIRHILDANRIEHNWIDADDENEKPSIMLTVHKDGDCKSDIVNIIQIDGNLLTFAGIAQNFELDKTQIPDAIMFCNSWNSTKYMPSVSVTEDGTFFASWCHLIDIDISDDYIKENMIVSFVSNTWSFFCDLSKDFFDNQ